MVAGIISKMSSLITGSSLKKRSMYHLGSNLGLLSEYFIKELQAYILPSLNYLCCIFFRFRLLQFRVLQIPVFRIPGFTYSGLYNSGFYRFRLLHVRVLQIPFFTIPGFRVPHSIPNSIPWFLIPSFVDSQFGLVLSQRSVS